MEDECPNCGDPLYPFRPRWWKGEKDLLLCRSCWHKYDKKEDGSLERVKKPIKTKGWAHKRGY